MVQFNDLMQKFKIQKAHRIVRQARVKIRKHSKQANKSDKEQARLPGSKVGTGRSGKQNPQYWRDRRTHQAI